MSQEKIAWIRLAMTPLIGPMTFKHLIAKFGSAVNALSELPAYAAIKRKKYVVPSENEIIDYVKSCEKKNVSIVAAYEPTYPKKLLRLSDNPPILHLFGNQNLLNKRSIAIVGARNCSIQGKAFAKKLAQDLAANEIIIVSGLARGIDAAAHEAKVDGTIAVLANGVDIVYPMENKALYDKILAEGLIISEERLGKEPRNDAFTYRNRIVSGLSDAVVVVEAALKSGSLITADYATQQGIDVFAVPGHPYDYRSAGTNYLIKNGAYLLENAQDILQHIEMKRSATIELFAEENMNEDFDNTEDVKLYILESLGTAPISVNQIVSVGEFSVRAIHSAIAELDLEGEVHIEGSMISKIMK